MNKFLCGKRIDRLGSIRLSMLLCTTIAVLAVAVTGTFIACEKSVSEPEFTAVESSAMFHSPGRGYVAPRTDGFLTTPDGTQLYYRIAGNGPDTVVALHGGPGLSASHLIDNWDFLAAGRTIIYYDQRGGGHSDLEVELTTERMVADLEAVREYFGLEELKLIGQSWGAMLASLYAIEHTDRVNRMVLVTPGPVAQNPFEVQFFETLMERQPPEVQAKLDSLAGEMLFGDNPVEACEQWFTINFSYYLHDPANIGKNKGNWCEGGEDSTRQVFMTFGTVVGSLGPDWDFRPALSELSVPTLVVHGIADALPLGSSEGYAEIQGAELLILSDAGHYPWFEDAPKFFTPVNNFLRRADASLRGPAR